MDDGAQRRETPQRQAVADYKAILKRIIDRRPSGLRGRLAEAMGKNRSFVSQITNPAYDTPIPARHLETIFRIGHVSAEERADFLAAYELAHPGRLGGTERRSGSRRLVIEVRDLGDEARNRRMDRLLRDLAVQLGHLMEERD